MTSNGDENHTPSPENLVIGRGIKTKVLEKISSGSYGDIHYGIFLNTGEKVAVKLENQRMPHAQLLSEGNIMRHLEGGPGIPKVWWFGCHEPLYNCMVMDLLGPNLQELFAYCGHKFSLKTVLLIAHQVLASLHHVHSLEYLHRDIKPDNFAIGPVGSSTEHKIFLFDFGLSKKFQRRRYSVSSMSPTGHPMVGTVRYMGLHAHEGSGDMPRDDMESLAYCLVYFLKGSLPWQGIHHCTTREEKLQKIRMLKSSLSAEQLCSDLPSIFTDLVLACRACRSVTDTSVCPEKWRMRFEVLASEKGVVYDDRYDWTEKRDASGEPYALSSPHRGHVSS